MSKSLGLDKYGHFAQCGRASESQMLLGGKSHKGLITSERKASFFDSGHPHRLDKSCALFPAGQLKGRSKFFTKYRFQHHSLFNFVRLKFGGTALVELAMALKLCKMSNLVGVQVLFPIKAMCKFSAQKCFSKLLY